MELAKAADIAKAYTKLDPELKMYLKGYLDGAADQKREDPADPKEQEEKAERPA